MKDLIAVTLTLATAAICCGSAYTVHAGRAIRIPIVESVGGELYAEWLRVDTDTARRAFDARIRSSH